MLEIFVIIHSLKKYLLERENYRCAYCEKSIVNESTIHHIDYDNKCTFSKTLIIHMPTEKRPNRKRTVPDCEKCKSINENKFNHCMSKITIVHKYCNKLINDDKNRQCI